MTSETGANASRELQNGEIVHLVKEPGSKWHIRDYECRHRVVLRDMLMFEYLRGLPEDWKNLEFDTADDAAAFVQQQIHEAKVPRNSQ